MARWERYCKQIFREGSTMADILLLVGLVFVALCLVGWLLGGAATLAGNAWRNIGPHESARQERIAQYRARHPNEPVYTPWDE